MKLIKKMVPYLLICAFAFYLMPLISGDKNQSVMIIVFYLPLVCIITSFIYGLKNGASTTLPMATGLLFIPTIFIYYNSSAWVYTCYYALLSFLGTQVGQVFKRKLKQ